MTESDWIILRLIMEIDRYQHGLERDGIKATQYLIKRHGKKKLQKYVDILENERIAKIMSEFKKDKGYL